MPILPNQRVVPYINLKLAALGCPTVDDPAGGAEFAEMATLLAHQREVHRLLANYLPPVDNRVQTFLYDYLQEAPLAKLPARTFVLDRPGLARALSLPPTRDEFKSEIVHSYRVAQGILHNPKSDRRTTQGIFHVAEGGLPVPDDKRSVPKRVFGRMLQLAFAPPAAMLRLPFTAAQAQAAECFVSLLLRPVVCPAVPGFSTEKSMEIRFFAPGSLVSNLDFVESIFGNAGDPFLPENDAGLDPEHWTGHTGCVVLAPHLTAVRKKDVGLPSWEAATERQRRDGMCWRDPDELYNGGLAFKLTARDEAGVIVTIIADNYFGYCKKEVKTQISYAANLLGACEEEHAGGALVFPSYDLGEVFSGELHVAPLPHTFAEMTSLYGGLMEVTPDGFAVDKRFPDIIYVPEDVRFDLHAQSITWVHEGTARSIKLLPGRTYVRPSGYKVQMVKPPGGRSWRLVGTVAEGTLCHKPCTVSGGGKSEISKSIADAIIQGPVFVADFHKDFERVTQLINHDYGDRFRAGRRKGAPSRPILSPARSLGSVIRLLTPAPEEYTDEYLAWLSAIPQYIKELVFVLKRFYRPEWGEHWRDHFSVDVINGVPAHELKCDNRKLVTNYLRVGYNEDGSWRTFGLRKDFYPAAKVALEDDITASVVVPAGGLHGLNDEYQQPSMKFIQNVESRLFQRPDEAVHPGYDKQTETDFAQSGSFFSNYEPLTRRDALRLMEDAITFDQFTAPMQGRIREAAAGGNGTYFVSSAHPRLVEGRPSKNPRYLQLRPDLVDPRDAYLAEIGARLRRRLPLRHPVLTPVNAVLPGRRNHAPEGPIRPLAVFNPIHYLELPELFMEFICSMTGKSPSTTGAGSEGALTKGPFNALPPIIDLNAALVSYLLTGHAVFITAAGHVGPHFRVDHDISLLVPEVWSRMTVRERDPQFLIDGGYLEKCHDFEYRGRTVRAGLLGYRITNRFVATFFGRVFNHPDTVLTEAMLRPERQDANIFADGMENVIATQKRVAQSYFDDGSIEAACPPLRALLHIMREDQFEGKDLAHPDTRLLFTRETMLASPWYGERLSAKQLVNDRLWTRHARALEAFLNKRNYADEAARLRIADRLERARRTLDAIRSPDYRKSLRGTIGAQPLTMP
ncbi:MAG: hypothetical protein JO069_16005 [Verrucomicrobia bacterium]|nr:hypothetical protein [Verrucomicrobiota bacterium]